jgi:hypothetical protein
VLQYTANDRQSRAMLTHGNLSAASEQYWLTAPAVPTA